MFNNLIGSKATDRSKAFFDKLHQLAISTCLIIHQSRKFSADGFLLTLIKSILTGNASFNQMAMRLGGFEPLKMSKQAFWKRLDQTAIAFLLEALGTSLREKFLAQSGGKLHPLEATFNRVLVEDSVSHRLHPSNAAHSPGHGNGRSKTSVLKVDVTIDLLSGTCVKNALHGGTEQDKELGKNLVEDVEKRDLVLRDMGYFIIGEFIEIERKGAFWLSRLPANVIATNETGEKIEKVLASVDGGHWQGCVLVGEKEKHRARLVAARATPEVARKNLEEASKRPDGSLRELTKEQRERCHWHLIVTNIPREKLTIKQLGELYRCRWSIEIIFRAWKQGMNLTGALNRRSSELHHQALILAAMIYQVLTMTAVNLLKPHMHRGERISVEKVFDLMFDHLMEIQDIREWFDFEVDRRHIRMDPRKDRKPLVNTWLQLIS